MTLHDAVEDVKACEPFCAPHISKIASFVEYFSGEGELIDYLDEFAKALGCTGAASGCEFMSMLADFKLKSKITTLPFCRLACWLAQVANPKMVDGICKHLSTSHLAKFKSDENVDEVEAPEALLKQAWSMGPAISKDPVAGSFTGPARLAHGKFAVRCVLHFLGAEKDSREPKGFARLIDINQLYIKDLGKEAQKLAKISKDYHMSCIICLAGIQRWKTVAPRWLHGGPTVAPRWELLSSVLFACRFLACNK